MRAAVSSPAPARQGGVEGEARRGMEGKSGAAGPGRRRRRRSSGRNLALVRVWAGRPGPRKSPQTHLVPETRHGDGVSGTLKYSVLGARSGHRLCPSAAQQRRQRPMDPFPPDRHHVRLRSRVHGTYLHADEDGHGVSLSSGRASMNAAWVVHRYHGDDHHVLLHSAAYGRYLAATNTSAPLGCYGFRVEQRNYDELQGEDIRWHPFNIGGPGHILLRQPPHAAGEPYRYLRANGRYAPWFEHVVSVDVFDNISTMMQWVVEPIPSTEHVPRLPRPTMLHLHLAGRRRLAALLPSRLVDFIGNGERFFTNTVSFVFRGRSVFRQRNEVARRLGITRERNIAEDLVMYVRAGTYGRFTPLVVDLPRSSQTLIITVDPPANIVPRFPDFDA